MPRVLVAGSENDTHVVVVDFTTAASPTVGLIDPGFGAGTRVAIEGSSAVAGRVLTGIVRMIDVSNPAAPALQGWDRLNSTMVSGGDLNLDACPALGGTIGQSGKDRSC